MNDKTCTFSQMEFITRFTRKLEFLSNLMISLNVPQFIFPPTFQSLLCTALPELATVPDLVSSFKGYYKVRLAMSAKIIIVVLSVYINNLYWQWLTPYSGFQIISTNNGFHLKSGFKKRLSTQTMVLVLNLISWKSFALPTQSKWV